MREFILASSLLVLAAAVVTGAAAQEARRPQTGPDSSALSGTTVLTAQTPLSDRILESTHRFLDAKIAAARSQREAQWKQIMQSPADQRDRQLQRLRQRLREITGVIDTRSSPVVPQTVAPLGQSVELASAAGLTVQEIRWPVIDGYRAAGLVVQPKVESSGPPTPLLATVIVMPDAATTADELVGLTESSESSTGFPLQLAALGCRVIVPYPITRREESRGGRVVLTDREYVYRTTFVLGRHPLGLEVQSVLALVESVRASESGQDAEREMVTVVGHGEGGLVAMLAAAIDPRIDQVMVSGAFGNRDGMWKEPISRNVFGLLSGFGDAQLACLVAPRPMIIEPAKVPSFEVTAGGAAPGRIVSPSLDDVRQAVRSVEQIIGSQARWLQPIGLEEGGDNGNGALVDFASSNAVHALLAAMDIHTDALPDRTSLCEAVRAATARPPSYSRDWMLEQIEDLSDSWIRSSRDKRKQWVDRLDTSSLAAYEASIQPHRERFERDVIGRFEDPLTDPAMRTRLWKRTADWTGWHVEMDVFPEVIAGGILLVPHDASAEAPPPVVVCVHGLEGKAIDTIQGDHPAYRNFADRLCRRGYVVFCPQQLYLGQDRFRMLQRKANSIGKTLFSIMIPQHRQIIRVLQGLEFVDSQRIGFYGLSYGGKSAMRIPAVISEYGPTICSGDYNEWVLKNASTRHPFSYVWMPEYEIFEFNLANTFNYAEMAALICPRPFMVERGHHDGVAIDRWVAFEYAPVRFLYAARLGIPEHTEIEYFVGPHAIHGQGTFEFLDQHLKWPGNSPGDTQ